jgi:Na+/H+-translocating membrane pyrophosphatase
MVNLRVRATSRSGLLGTAIAVTTMLGIAEMSGLPKEVRHNTDAVGNATKAVTMGCVAVYAIAILFGSKQCVETKLLLPRKLTSKLVPHGGRGKLWGAT